MTQGMLEALKEKKLVIGNEAVLCSLRRERLRRFLLLLTAPH